MPGTPTTPDNLPRISDVDSPDVPRDLNALADATQAALIKRSTEAGRTVFATLPADVPGTGNNSNILTASLPSSKAGSIWLCNMGFNFNTLNVGYYWSGMSAVTNCTVEMHGLPYWYGTPQVYSVFVPNVVKITADGAASVAIAVGVNDLSHKWVAVARSYISAVQIK